MYRYYWMFFTGFCLFCACRAEKTPANGEVIRPVKVVRVEALGTLSRQFTGVVEAREFSTLAFKVGGRLTELNVKTGQHVKKGEVIARILPTDFKLEYETAQADYNTAKAIFERNERLFAADAVAQQSVEIAGADYTQAEAALRIAGRTLGNTTLYAPFGGFIEERYTENFEEVAAGTPIVKLVNPRNIEVRFTLPENDIQLLQMPKKVSVEFDTQKGRLFAAEVKEYVYSSQGTGIPVSLLITDEAFAPYRSTVFPGFSCRVTWETDNMVANRFVIPTSAVVEDKGAEYVWTVDRPSLTVHRQAVTTTRYGRQALVEEGLSSNDLIVTAGAPSLREGQQVKIDY